MTETTPKTVEMQGAGNWLQRRPVLAFFLLTCAISWGSWLAAILLMPVARPALPAILRALTAFGPLVAVLVMVLLGQNQTNRQDFWRRLGRFSCESKQAWLVILLAFPALHLASILLDILSGGDWPTLSLVSSFAAQPWFLPLFALDMVVAGPLTQEIGWRGFGLDQLLKRMGPLTASLALGGLWAIWQFPLLFLDNQRLTLDQLLAPNPWLSLLTGVLSSVVFTWVFLRTNRSIFAVMLLRLSQNLGWALLPLSMLARFFQVLLLLPIVAFIAWTWSSRPFADGKLPTLDT